jgi:hypothetical protein
LRGTGNFNISGIFWSRAIERATYENVAVRVLCADTHPDHDTICTFRRENRALLDKAFSTVLELAARVGVMKVGQVTVAIDGTKVLANASKHAAASYEKADPPAPTPQASLLAACRPGTQHSSLDSPLIKMLGFQVRQAASWKYIAL